MNQKEISEKILRRFAETNSKPNHVIDQRWVYNNLFLKLNPKEQNLITPAINDLVDQKLITVEERSGGQCLVLTELGFDSIYVIDENKTIEQIQNAIMEEFKKTNSIVNNIIHARWISNILLPSLNPKEQSLVDPAINGLIDKGYILAENRNGLNCLVLTQPGFDKIYE